MSIKPDDIPPYQSSMPLRHVNPEYQYRLRIQGVNAACQYAAQIQGVNIAGEWKMSMKDGNKLNIQSSPVFSVCNPTDQEKYPEKPRFLFSESIINILLLLLLMRRTTNIFDSNFGEKKKDKKTP